MNAIELASMIENRIGQDFDGEAHFAEHEARQFAAMLRAQHEALGECAKPFFWEKEGFWPDASTPAHKTTEIRRRRDIASRVYGGQLDEA